MTIGSGQQREERAGRATRMRPRPIAHSLAAMLLTAGAGMAVRFGHMGLPAAVVKYGGSAAWALMIYWVVSTAAARWRPGRAGLVAAAIAAGVEFFKLYRSPAVDAFRGTLPGILLLGRYFSLRDIAAYWVAIAAGAWADGRLRRR